MIYNFDSYEKTILSLSEFTGINQEKINEFIYQNRKINYREDLLDRFIDYFELNLNKIDIRNVFLKIIQVTSNGDECESLWRHGLLNTQEAIKRDTYLSRFINSKGIYVDFNEKSIEFDGKKYCRRGCTDSSINLCLTKIFSEYHYPINGFIYSESPLKYSDSIYEVCELIRNLDDAFRSNIRRDWVLESEGYIVSFNTNVRNMHPSTYGLNDYDLEKYENEKFISEWLISKSLELLRDKEDDIDRSNIFAYMNPEYFVPTNEMSIKKITEDEIKSMFG